MVKFSPGSTVPDTPASTSTMQTAKASEPWIHPPAEGRFFLIVGSRSPCLRLCCRLHQLQFSNAFHSRDYPHSWLQVSGTDTSPAVGWQELWCWSTSKSTSKMLLTTSSNILMLSSDDLEFGMLACFETLLPGTRKLSIWPLFGWRKEWINIESFCRQYRPSGRQKHGWKFVLVLVTSTCAMTIASIPRTKSADFLKGCWHVGWINNT